MSEIDDRIKIEMTYALEMPVYVCVSMLALTCVTSVC